MVDNVLKSHRGNRIKKFKLGVPADGKFENWYEIQYDSNCLVANGELDVACNLVIFRNFPNLMLEIIIITKWRMFSSMHECHQLQLLHLSFKAISMYELNLEMLKRIHRFNL
ncbi:hypothetical protein AAHA92_32604 [Salvia divinorum]|uniref:Uncharacterized protein n=1 Tax=Salvia divinorum TaxID=28513 RepID=A0ABD1FLA8_SALDI